MEKKRIIGVLCVLGTTMCYGLVPSMSFKAYEVDVSWETLLFNKFFYGSILIWSYILIKKIPFRLGRKHVLPMITVTLSYAGIATALYLSFNYISGSLATIISFTYPALVLAFEMLKGKEKVRGSKLAALFLSLTGLCLIVWSPSMSINMLGVFWALLCALFYAVYAVGLSSDSLNDISPVTTAGYVLAVSMIINFFRCIASGNSLFTETPIQLAYILLLAVVCAFAAILLFCVGVRIIGAGNASIINTLEPVFACLFGYFFINDTITINMIIGGIFVVSAVLLTNLQSSTRKVDSY